MEVEDSGIGVPPEKQETIFQPFIQAESGYTRSVEGAGLGLTISRRLARLMGGDLTVRSTPGEGSVFTLWLPGESSVFAPIGDAVLTEVRGEEARRRGLASVGEALKGEVNVIIDRFTRRLRENRSIPLAAGADAADLEDHAAPFVVDLAQTLVVLETSEDAPERLLRDGSRIQRVIAELHGAQRSQIGWTEGMLRLEFDFLREEIEAAVRRSSPPGADVAEALHVLQRFLRRAERISILSLRDADETSGRGDVEDR
jgi:hypothetical protein